MEISDDDYDELCERASKAEDVTILLHILDVKAEQMRDGLFEINNLMEDTSKHSIANQFQIDDLKRKVCSIVNKALRNVSCCDE